ncbi:MAG: response regulator [Candidatus Marinimicrobia bacterium]|nr:response regulator [Candidatus Neomarinimicrobiota bacterium]
MAYKLLIVDDEKEIRDSLAIRYKLKGFETLKAENGKEALRILSEEKINIVLSDIIMPVMDGVKLIREIRNEYPMVKVIMMTGYVTLENALACYRYGAHDVIFKPLADLKELDNSILEIKDFLLRWQNKLSTLVNMKPKSE